MYHKRSDLRRRLRCRSRSSGLDLAHWPDEHIRRDAEPLVKTADHADRKATLSVQHLGDPGSRADDALEILATEALLLHPKLNRVDGIRRVHRMMFGLIGVDQRCEHIQAIALRRARC